jgi:hypothetical protein
MKGISGSGIHAAAVCACAALICAGTVAVAMPANRAAPILEELCARLAAFGLVEPMGMQPSSAPRRECKPVLFNLGAAPEPTSIFTTVRAGPGRLAGSPFIRFKLNALEPGTQDRAATLIGRAVRSLLRGYDLELPDSLAVALEQLEDGSHSVGPILMEIATEREDARRRNISLSIQSLEKYRTNFRSLDSMPGSPVPAAEQVADGL